MVRLQTRGQIAHKRSENIQVVGLHTSGWVTYMWLEFKQISGMTKLYARECICFSDMMGGTEQKCSKQCKIFRIEITLMYFILGSVGGSVTQQKSLFPAPGILPFWDPTEDSQVHIFTYGITINNNETRKTQGIQAHKVRKNPQKPDYYCMKILLS